jgi:hypothetical protein
MKIKDRPVRRAGIFYFKQFSARSYWCAVLGQMLRTFHGRQTFQTALTLILQKGKIVNLHKRTNRDVTFN